VCRATELDTNLGETCCLVGRVEEALMHGRRAIALDPLYVGALSMSLPRCSSRRGSRKSPEHYSRALARSPKFMVAHSNRGNALRALKRLPEADLSGGDRAQSALRASPEQLSARCCAT
jgi:tetratricopeptide (TPR) repeat protein